MAKADSSRVRISYIKQSGKGSIPNEAFQAVRHTEASFGMPQETSRSEEVRGDAQRGGAVRVGLNPEASISMELTAKTFDSLIEGLMRSSWSDDVDIADTLISADNTGSKFVGPGWLNENIEPGMWVFVSGFEAGGANGWFKVQSVSETDLVVSPAPADDSNAEENEIKVQGSFIRNGTDTPYYALQLEHLDLTNKFRLIKDARIGQMDLSIDARSRVTGSLQAVGAEFDLPNEKAGNGQVEDAPDTEILNTSDHLDGVFINGELFDGDVMSFSLSANMNPRRQNAVGKIASADIGLGSLDASGSIAVYLSDATWDDLLVKYKDFVKLSLAFALKDSQGSGYVFEMPRVALTNEPGAVPGPDNDVMLSMEFAAEPADIGDESKTFQICRRRA
jgi:hypothetical protein